MNCCRLHAEILHGFRHPRLLISGDTVMAHESQGFCDLGNGSPRPESRNIANFCSLRRLSASGDVFSILGYSHAFGK